MKILISILGIIALPILVSCDSGPKSSRGFTLPDGNAEVGRTVYLAFQCNECHRIADIPQLSDGKDSGISVKLGGKTTRIATYGELVTSIINPSHRLASGYSKKIIAENGHSRMKVYNDVMTVGELIDLVAFVQANYELQPFEPTMYPMYP